MDDVWPGGSSPSCERNRQPILEVLAPLLSDVSNVLEVGSGTGQHACYFAQAMPHLQWQPADQPEWMPGLVKNLQAGGGANIRQPFELNVSADQWPDAAYDAIYTANTLHIMSWDNVCDFFAGVGKGTAPDSVLCVYGPFNYDGNYTSESNAAFDRSLKQRDPLSGIRDFEAVDELAKQQGFGLEKDYAMPANNRLLVWRKL